MRLSFLYPLLVWSGHVESTGGCSRYTRTLDTMQLVYTVDTLDTRLHPIETAVRGTVFVLDTSPRTVVWNTIESNSNRHTKS